MGFDTGATRSSEQARRSARGRLLVLGVFMARTAGKRAAQAVLPLYFTIAIVAFVLFGGNGLEAKLVTGVALQRTILRATLLGAWVLATLPFARVWLTSDQTRFLRALPIPNAAMLGVLALGSCGAQLPWFVLWLRGAGLAAALAATATALALQAAWVAKLRNARDAAAAVLGALWLIEPSEWLAPVAGYVFARALARAWERAAEADSAGRHCVSIRNRPFALASALGVALYRGHAPVFVRVGSLTLTACAFAVLSLLNNTVSDGERSARIAMLLWTPACIFGVASLAGPLLRIEQQLGWLLALGGVSMPFQRSVAASVLALPALLAGGAFASAIGFSLKSEAPDALALALELGVAGAAWAAIGLALARASLRNTGRDSGRLLLGWLFVYIASLALALIPRALGAALLLVVGIAATVLPGLQRRDAAC